MQPWEWNNDLFMKHNQTAFLGLEIIVEGCAGFEIYTFEERE